MTIQPLTVRARPAHAMEYRCILRPVHFRNVKENEESEHPTSFALRAASDLDKVDVGWPLFDTDNLHRKIEGFVTKKKDQIQLTKNNSLGFLMHPHPS